MLIVNTLLLHLTILFCLETWKEIVEQFLKTQEMNDLPFRATGIPFSSFCINFTKNYGYMMALYGYEDFAVHLWLYVTRNSWMRICWSYKQLYGHARCPRTSAQLVPRPGDHKKTWLSTTPFQRCPLVKRRDSRSTVKQLSSSSSLVL